MSIKLGITGGIGSGKSVVSHLLQVMDIPVYYTDDEAKRLMVEDASIRRELVTLLGTEVYLADGSLDRRMLAAYIFGHPERVEKVNHIVHPRVRADFEQWVNRYPYAPLVAMECAILYESGFDAAVDKVVAVAAPLPLRIARAVRRDSTSEVQIRQRIAHQLPQEELGERADYLINNDDTSPLIPQVLHLMEGLKAVPGSD